MHAVFEAQGRQIELVDHDTMGAGAMQLLDRHVEQHLAVLEREMHAGERRRLVLDP
jgi:hypothetical protein